MGYVVPAQHPGAFQAQIGTADLLRDQSDSQVGDPSRCVVCARPLCGECALERDGRSVCREHGGIAFVEGWAVYATELMLDQGYMDGSPELRLTFLKQVLRLLANAVIDIRLHTAGMTDQECLDLMTRRTFQEKEEAIGKLQRAKLSSCQLPTYFVGWRGWQKIHHASQLPLAEFHRRALAEGAVPLPVLERLLK